MSCGSHLVSVYDVFEKMSEKSSSSTYYLDFKGLQKKRNFKFNLHYREPMVSFLKITVTFL